MKPLSTAIFLLVFLNANAQRLSKEQILDGFIAQFKNDQAIVVCDTKEKIGTDKDKNSSKARIVTDATFDSLFLPIISRVVVNSEDLVKNGTASSLSFNEATKKLSIGRSWRGKKNNYWNAGFNTETGSKNVFEFFNKDGWVQGFGLNISQTKSVYKKTLLFKTEDCEELKKKRRIFFSILLAKYNNLLSTDSIEILNRIVAIEAHDIENQEQYIKLMLPKLYTTWNLYQADKDSLTQIRRVSNTGIKNEVGNYDFTKVLSKDFSEFEKEHFKKFGFKIHWINFGGGVNFKTFSIYDTAVRRLAEIKKKETWRININANYNYMRETVDRNLFYFTLGLTFGNTDFLEELLPSDISILKENPAVVGSEIKKDYEALVVKDYDKLRKDYAFFAPSFGLNYFFGTKRFFGLELQGDTKFKFLEPVGVDARNTFTLKGGVLFSFEGEKKLAKTTFGIIASFNNIPFNDIAAKDRFTAGVRIGVPFNF